MKGVSRSWSPADRNSEVVHEVTRLALTQHAVVAVRQIVALGTPARTVSRRVAAGRWFRVHHGVVAIVPPQLLATEGWIMAGVLACVPGTLASHRSAAVLFDLRLRRRPWVDVTTAGSAGRRRRGLHQHSGATLAPEDVDKVDDVPCTSLARTLLDIAEDATEREIERAIDRATELRLIDMRALDGVLGRARGRRGAVRLQAVLTDHRAGSTLTRNDLEEAFLSIARGIGRPPDAVNHWMAFAAGGGAEGDFVWHRRRLVVEVDGRGPHTTRRAFEHDRRRDQQLALLGYRVVRFTWRQVTGDPRYVGRTLSSLLREDEPSSYTAARWTSAT